MVSFQKKLSAKILKVGTYRVWLDPAKMKDVEKAITRIDLKKLIKQGAIKVMPEKLRMHKEKRGRRGPGSKKGSKFSVISKKTRWINTVRPLRETLKKLKDTSQIENSTYRKMRSLIKGGMFRSRHHLKIYLEQHDLLKKVSK